jgi:hypothetical protein
MSNFTQVGSKRYYVLKNASVTQIYEYIEPINAVQEIANQTLVDIKIQYTRF